MNEEEEDVGRLLAELRLGLAWTGGLLISIKLCKLLSRQICVSKIASRRASLILHLHFNQPGEPLFIIINQILFNILLSCIRKNWRGWCVTTIETTLPYPLTTMVESRWRRRGRLS